MTNNTTYADLEIRILKQEKAGYPVEITLNNERQFKRGYLAPGPESESWESMIDPVADGQRLFEWFLADGNLNEAWGQVREQRPHRIRLRIDRDAPELHAVPWELLQEPGEGDLIHNIAQNIETPFSRYLAGTWHPGNPILKRPLKMLVAIANPENLEADYKLSPIELEQEWALLEEVTQGVAVTCDLLPQPCTLSALEDKLKEGYHILHFIGHGSYSKKKSEAVLYMADEAIIAREYVDWLDELFNYPFINSASFYMISSPYDDWVSFTWRHEDGGFKPVVRLVGQMDRPESVAPTAQSTREASPATVAAAATPAAEVTDYTNQYVIDACRKAANRLGLGNWDLMGKAGLRLRQLAKARQSTYSGPKLAELAQLSPGEKEKIRAMLPAITPAAGADLSFSVPTGPSPGATGCLKSRRNLADAPLAFPRAEQLRLAPAKDSTERSVIRTWNRYGWLLLISDALQIEPGAAVALVSQHFRQRGFGADGRMRLRFETHLFFERWGLAIEVQYQQHFKFNPNRPWQQHQWRPAKNQAWRDVHDNQDSEWAAYELTYTLDETAAQKSIAMGAPSDRLAPRHHRLRHDRPDVCRLCLARTVPTV